MVHSCPNGLDWRGLFGAKEMIIEEAKRKGLYLAFAESLTAGALCSELVATPGASEVVLGGINSYQDETKQHMLGVSGQLIHQQSSVDPEVAAQMALGAASRFANAMSLDDSKVIGVSTTGVAGPDSVGSHEPGEVYIGIASRNGVSVYSESFQGDRSEIRRATVLRAVELIWEEIGRL